MPARVVAIGLCLCCWVSAQDLNEARRLADAGRPFEAYQMALQIAANAQPGEPKAAANLFAGQLTESFGRFREADRLLEAAAAFTGAASGELAYLERVRLSLELNDLRGAQALLQADYPLSSANGLARSVYICQYLRCTQGWNAWANGILTLDAGLTEGSQGLPIAARIELDAADILAQTDSYAKGLVSLRQCLAKINGDGVPEAAYAAISLAVAANDKALANEILQIYLEPLQVDRFYRAAVILLQGGR